MRPFVPTPRDCDGDAGDGCGDGDGCGNGGSGGDAVQNKKSNATTLNKLESAYYGRLKKEG